jgi:Zn-dependent peptidase ImmA (M78 family)
MRIKLYNFTLEVHQVTREQIEKKAPNSDGCFDFDNMQILIDKDAHPQAKRYILKHEIVHAILYLFGYGEMDEEQTCNFMACHHEEITKICKTIFRD